MRSSEVDFLAIRDRIVLLLRQHEAALSTDSKEAVQHYIAHDEYEIALEGLCLDLIEEGLMTAENLAEGLELGEALGLDEESVLRDDFWSLLTALQ